MIGFVRKKLETMQAEGDAWYEKYSKTLPIPEGVKIDTDVSYKEENSKYNLMDIYYPEKEEGNAGKLPVIFYYHGGGMAVCDKSLGRWFCAGMAKRGFLVFAVDFPTIMDGHTAFDIIKDAYAGMVKGYEMIDAYNGNKGCISIVGSSAGVFITTYLLAAHNNIKVANALGLQRMDIEIKNACAMCGMFYTSKMDSTGLFALRRYYFGRGYRRHPFWKYINPECPEVLSGQPPTIFVTSKGDYMRQYTLDMIRAYDEAGIRVYLQDFIHSYHLMHDFVCLEPEKKESQEAMDRIGDFFKRTCDCCNGCCN